MLREDAKGNQFLSGNEAVALGAHDFGVRVATAYPGTPSTEILERISQFYNIYSEWSCNEKVAMEVAIGASLGGVRSLVSMKHVGLNVAADPLFTSSYIGVKGGLVFISADDPGMHSSQNEQDNRHYALAAKIPMFEPVDSQDAYQLIGLALNISEQYDTPVLFRMTTRLSHSKGIVSRNAEYQADLEGSAFEPNAPKYVMIPVFARQRHMLLEERMHQLQELSETIASNRIEWGERDVGIITSGVAYQYAKEAFPQASFLKLGFTHPLPINKIKSFASKVKQVFVVEELDPYLERQIKALKIPAIGKDRFPICGELSPEIIQQGIAGKSADQIQNSLDIPVRPPVLCPGCPHTAALYTIKKCDLNVLGDIGCYTLSVAPPLEAMDTTLCMGASIGMAHGLDKASGPTGRRSCVAVIGDGTFLHSGITALLNLVYNQGTSTVIILDNRTTAMTGFQDHAATGMTLQRDNVPELDLEALIKVLGIPWVKTLDPYNLKEFEEGLREAIDAPCAAVIIARRACLLIPESEKRSAMLVDPEICNTCRQCLKIGCPAISLTSDNKAEIDPILCNGCPVCEQVCELGAIYPTIND